MGGENKNEKFILIGQRCFSSRHLEYLKSENPNKKIKLDKKDVNQRKIQSSIDRNEFEQIFFQEFVPPKKVENFVKFKIEITSNSIYLTGNYNKYEVSVKRNGLLIIKSRKIQSENICLNQSLN